MLNLTCTMISSVDLAHYGISRAKDWLSENCGTIWFGYISRSSGLAKTMLLGTVQGKRRKGR